MADYCPSCNADSDDIEEYANGDHYCTACGNCWNCWDDDEEE